MQSFYNSAAFKSSKKWDCVYESLLTLHDEIVINLNRRKSIFNLKKNRDQEDVLTLQIENDLKIFNEKFSYLLDKLEIQIKKRTIHPDHATERRFQLIRLQTQLKSLQMKYSVILENEMLFKSGFPIKSPVYIPECFLPQLNSQNESADNLSITTRSCSIVDIQSSRDNSAKSSDGLDDDCLDELENINYDGLQYVLNDAGLNDVVIKKLRKKSDLPGSYQPRSKNVITYRYCLFILAFIFVTMLMLYLTA